MKIMRLCVSSLLSSLTLLSLLSASTYSLPARAGELPPDVRPTSWAAPYVEETLNNQLLTLPDGKEFHGEAKVTHLHAVFALAKLAKMLEAHTWKAHASRPINDSVSKAVAVSDWRTQKVTRYEFAKVLACMGDYVTNGLPRPTADAKDLGKSGALPPKPKLTLEKSHPAYASLSYLIEANMIRSGSPLLLADNKPILGTELSRAVSDVVIGITNHATELGLDENGETPDATSVKKQKEKQKGKKDK